MGAFLCQRLAFIGVGTDPRVNGAGDVPLRSTTRVSIVGDYGNP